MRPRTKPEPLAARESPPSERGFITLAGPRYVALDAFRGIAIAAMILVNTPGAREHRIAALRHASWNGCTIADLIFPAFLFIVGVALWLSLGQATGRGAPRPQLAAKVLRRAALIFALGVLLNGFPLFEWSHLRIPGILQRIALCYLLASIFVLTCGVRGLAVAIGALLAAETALLVLVAVPGATDAFQGPEANVGAVLDNLLLHRHLLHEGWDPEGLLGTLSATATTLAGVLAGRYWIRTPRPEQRIATLFAIGTLCVLAGLALAPWLPINKTLWTASFAIFTCGVSLGMLGLCSWLLDVRGYRTWAKPFVVYGSNPLLAFMLSELGDKVLWTWMVTTPDGRQRTMHTFIYDAVFLRVFSDPYASLAYSLVYVALWLLPLGLLYRYRIFVKL